MTTNMPSIDLEVDPEVLVDTEEAEVVEEEVQVAQNLLAQAEVCPPDPTVEVPVAPTQDLVLVLDPFRQDL